MANRPELDEWLDAADELLDGPVLVGRRLVVVPQERGRQVEVRYGALLGDAYVQLVNVDPASGRADQSILLQLHRLRRFLAGTGS